MRQFDFSAPDHIEFILVRSVSLQFDCVASSVALQLSQNNSVVVACCFSYVLSGIPEHSRRARMRRAFGRAGFGLSIACLLICMFSCVLVSSWRTRIIPDPDSIENRLFVYVLFYLVFNAYIQVCVLESGNLVRSAGIFALVVVISGHW